MLHRYSYLHQISTRAINWGVRLPLVIASTLSRSPPLCRPPPLPIPLPFRRFPLPPPLLRLACYRRLSKNPNIVFRLTERAKSNIHQRCPKFDTVLLDICAIPPRGADRNFAGTWLVDVGPGDWGAVEDIGYKLWDVAIPHQWWDVWVGLGNVSRMLDQYYRRCDGCGRYCVEIALRDGEKVGRGRSGYIAVAVAALHSNDSDQRRSSLEF